MADEPIAEPDETRIYDPNRAAIWPTFPLVLAAVHLHALVSLIAQAEELLPEAVHQARDQDYTWAQIGQLVNLAPSTTAKRYRPRS